MSLLWTTVQRYLDHSTDNSSWIVTQKAFLQGFCLILRSTDQTTEHKVNVLHFLPYLYGIHTHRSASEWYIRRHSAVAFAPHSAVSYAVLLGNSYAGHH